MTSVETTPALVLESGARMTREEFHRLYEASPRLEHVQLIEGVVYMPSPIRMERHGEAQGMLLGWLSHYSADHPEVRFAGPASVLLDGDNEPEPDAMMFLRDGQATVTGDDYLAGAPELVCEVAGSSRAIDLGDKLRAYRRNGVREYIVWVTGERRLLWFALRDGEYVEAQPGVDGIIESEVFPGLRLHVPSLLNWDMAGVRAGLNGV